MLRFRLIQWSLLRVSGFEFPTSGTVGLIVDCALNLLSIQAESWLPACLFSRTPSRRATDFAVNMKTLRTILLASALFVTAALRAEAPFEAPTASEAFPVYADANRVTDVAKLPTALRNVFTRLAEADTAIIPFVEQRRMGIFKKPVELSGTMRYSRKAGLSIAYEQPKPRVLIIDDVGLIERQPDGRERRLAVTDRPELAVLTEIYLNLLRGKPAGLFSASEVYFMGNASGWQIGLIPRDASLRKHTGRVLIGGSNREIAQISNLLENGDRRTLRLSKSEIDAKFNSSIIQSYFRTNTPDRE